MIELESREILEEVLPALLERGASHMHAGTSVQWVIRDSEPKYTLYTFGVEGLTIHHGLADTASLTLAMGRQQLADLLDFKLDVDDATRRNQLVARGDLGVLLQLVSALENTAP